MTAAAELSLTRWLPDRAALTPDRVAIEFGDRQITYAGLAASAAEWAAAFASTGLRAGDRVATLARNRPEQVAVFFACAQSGLILVPLNWRLTAPELAYQLGDAAPALLLADPELRELAVQARDRAALDGSPVEIAQLTSPPAPAVRDVPSAPAARDVPPAAVTGDDPLLILYTSGTTGRPKGAVLTHANCFWTNLSLDRTGEVNGGDVVLQVLPQCHVGGWNVQPLLAWWKGATVVLEQSFDAARVLDLIESKKITTMMGVPTNYQMLAAQPGFATADLSSLRQVIVGGAPMPRPVLETWLARGVTVLQGYGLTEAAPNVLCVPAEYATEKTGSAGRPYLHVRVALRDLGGGDLIAGTGTGELLVAGPNVFAGYWRNPQATKAALDGGWLATGDIAERDADGFYWIRGRSKDMYISGGENVYPAEVEEALIGHESVLEAAVVGVPDQRWGETGLAFVVLRPGRDISDEELTAYCRSRLARYKVPTSFRPVARLPKLTSGKLDKVTLRQMIADSPQDGNGCNGGTGIS
jgi:fatty-acyl-CoA synthase